MNAPRRRAIAAILIVAVASIVLAACGSDSADSGAKGKNPLDTALRYAPKDTAFVAAVQTDVRGAQIKDADAILDKFPFAGQVKRIVRDQLFGRLDFGRDIEPALGNQAIVASTDTRSFLDEDRGDDRFVGALVVKDRDAFQKALDRGKPQKAGEVDGTTIQRDGDTYYVLDGDAFVFSGNRRDLEAAVKNASGDDHFGEADLDKGTEGLPKRAAARFSFNAKALLQASPDAAQALKIKWVAALRTVGVAATVQRDRLDVDFRAATDAGGLSDGDLPMASGTDSPAVIDRKGRVGVGFRGLDQVYRFVVSALQATSPSDYRGFQQGKSTIEKQLDIDIQKDIVDQLSGEINTSTATDGQNASRVELKDPAAFEKTLTKVNKVIPGIDPGLKVKRAGDGLYSVDTGRLTIVYGVVGDYFVVANSTSDAKAVASATGAKVDGAKGAISLKSDAAPLAEFLLSQLTVFGDDSSALSGLSSALGASLVTGPLDELTGSVDAETGGITGNLSLTFK